ncbi:MAG: hypothetical protein HKO55_00960 [Gammaproteobacteria bacterium]|nr:hypothetical protein [Gammaproteobacteria bacterium]
MNKSMHHNNGVTGDFVTLDGERYYAIHNVDAMAPFFINLVSDNDLWMFIASNGGLTAGRMSPDNALFPYVTVDKLYDSVPNTGSTTLLRIVRNGQQHDWEPFNREHDDRYRTTRNLYKSALGDKLLFEEINHDLELRFRYSWASSETYGFVRTSELENGGAADCRVELVDGLQNLLPAGTPRFTQTNSSYLVDAYKWSELDESSGLALFTLFSGISDRAEPCESLRATTAFCLGLDDCRILLSSQQLEDFHRGAALQQETRKRGIRCAFLVNASFDLPAQASHRWQTVLNGEQSQADAVDLIQQLRDRNRLGAAIDASVAAGSVGLARIMAAADGFQSTAEENVSEHHYANVLFNVLRGGIVNDQYRISRRDFRSHLQMFNQAVCAQHRDMLDALPEQIDYSELMTRVKQQNDPQLERLAHEYLPITFGRRHGDPSRPWNQFSIRLKDDHDNPLLTYEGNWRDIFQNWEALLLSYPEFTENVISKFVNASTVDGYNPYRITNEGIDWEVEEPDDPWSYIGYWGDHQIIYLQKLLELSQQFHPQQLGELLHRPLFSYANVPYRIKPFADVLANAKSTVLYDDELADRIEQRVAELGSDGKLVLDDNGSVYQVNLLEKLVVALLAKLGNLVVDGGIWLNTQRPEWNDANNALVGQGLSMVTLYYLRRYVTFMQQLLAGQPDTFELSTEVREWLAATAAALADARSDLGDGPVDATQRHRLLTQLGEAASRYRLAVYEQGTFRGTESQETSSLNALLDDALAAIDHSIVTNRREDGMYHAYNLLGLQPSAATVDTLYPMLEGQVAALSSGAVSPQQAVDALEALFASELFRADQQSFLLYPDRDLPDFLEKNSVPAAAVESVPLLQQMLDRDDRRIIERDAAGTYRFNADFQNVADLDAALDELTADYGNAVATARAPLQELYEQVFDHQSFTGRSGGMFGFEGLGSIYWHMVSKLLVAAQEVYFTAREQDDDDAACRQLADLYYRIRAGIGFNKTPAEYGAFPTDPYSHTPKHAGAQQPGMTGQVKEEILTRFGELGVRVRDGAVEFDPALLRSREFLDSPQPYRFLDVDGTWQELTVHAHGLAFSWCQVPVVYTLDDNATPSITLIRDDGKSDKLDELALPAPIAQEVFRRTGRIRQINLTLTRSQLLL